VILRGAVLSEKRIALEPTKLERPPPRPVIAAPDAMLERPPISLVPPAISLEAVIQWLSTRDEATRAALAAHLAPDIEDLQVTAQQEGFAAGKSQALSESQARLQSVLASLQALVASADAAFERESKALEEQCTEVVCEALAKIAGPLLSTREAALGAVVELIKRLRDAREIVIRVNATDLPMLQAEECALAAALGGRPFSIVADRSLHAGGVIVDTTLGSLDGRFDIQLAAALETLRAARPQSEVLPQSQVRPQSEASP
jgi:flagellar biosynthesis/type III secretory pathway protein FliH